MAPATFSVLISSFPGLALSVPYNKDEPLHFLRDRLSNRLCDTTACVDPELASLYLDGKRIPDYDKSMDHYRRFGDTLTYKNVKVRDLQDLWATASVQPSWSLSDIPVHVLTVTGTSIKVNIHKESTVEELKQVIFEAVTQTIWGKLRLYFNGAELQDEKTLADYSIESNATVHMLTQCVEYPTITVYVKTLTRKTCAFQVNLGQTVYQLKKSVADKLGIPVDEQRLTFGGKQLEDDRILNTYHISDGSTGDISLRLAGGHELLPTFADVSTGQTETLLLSWNAPKGRTVTCGTNIELQCECTRYTVFSNQGFELYELGKSKVKCPNCCSTDVKPVTVGFLQCAYRIHGVKADWTSYKSDWIEVNEVDQFQRYDPSEQMAWRRLGVESKPLYQSGTTVCTICLEDILGCAKRLPCGHCFHKKCIASWKLHCPNCRAHSV